jgi:hypothetical protein
MVNPVSARAVRVRHYQGQRLLANDLQDDYDNPAWLRGLHVVALHDTWGIALGFDVTLASDGSVVVGPGFAYDARGREIVLAHERGLPGPLEVFPPESRPLAYELVASYDAELGRREASLDLVPCTGAGDRPGHERPAFAWRRPGTTRLGLEAPLMAVRVAAGKLTNDPLDPSVRRYAQAQARPHIAAGVTPPQQVWLPNKEHSELTLGYQTLVDTRDAGFIGTPYYLAQLRFGKAGVPDTLAFLLAGFANVFLTSVVNPGPDRFTFRVVPGREERDVAGVAGGHPALAFVAAATSGSTTTVARLPWQVSWVGVEPVSGCAPQLSLAFIEAFLRFRREFTPLFLEERGLRFAQGQTFGTFSPSPGT